MGVAHRRHGDGRRRCEPRLCGRGPEGNGHAREEGYETKWRVNSAASIDFSGEALHGDAFNGEVDAQAVDGEAVSGEAVDGEAVDGEAVSGEAVDGEAVVDAANAPTEAITWARQSATFDELAEVNVGRSRRRGVVRKHSLFGRPRLARSAIEILAVEFVRQRRRSRLASAQQLDARTVRPREDRVRRQIRTDGQGLGPLVSADS